MIFFYKIIPIEFSGDYTIIPIECGDDYKNITVDKIQLVSWNQIQYKLNERSELVNIDGFNKLKNCIIEVAKQDDVCKDVNQNAYDQYGVYLFEPTNFEKDKHVHKKCHALGYPQVL